MAYERPHIYLRLISKLFYITSSNGSPSLAIKQRGKNCIAIFRAVAMLALYVVQKYCLQENSTTRMSQTVTILTCIQKKPSSNSGWVTEHHDYCVSWFYSVPHSRCPVLHTIISKSQLPTPYQILDILPSNRMLFSPV